MLPPAVKDTREGVEPACVPAPGSTLAIVETQKSAMHTRKFLTYRFALRFWWRVKIMSGYGECAYSFEVSVNYLKPMHV